MDYEKIKEAIFNTGFPLEFKISSILKKHGWQTINNRYYIDDVKEIEREIDILAYKCKVDHDNKIAFYTSLIISCKKSSTGLWTFLSTEKPTYDPNFKFFVIANKTSDKRLEKMLDLEAENIEKSFCSEKRLDGLFKINRKTFGFQQLNKDSYKCEDDKKIYDSIITSIKALEYEISIKQNKKNIISEVDTTFYNFNLISIFDGEMAEIYFEEDKVKPDSVDNVMYINRHIINKKENFYKVHFIKSSKFEEYLNLYDDLNQVNYQIFDNLIADYYNKIFSSKEKAAIYWKEFSKDINWIFNYTLHSKLNYKSAHNAERFDFEYENNTLKIYYDGYWDVDDPGKDNLINKEEELIDTTKKKLLKYFRYSGDFRFEEESLPF
jgi:hypothetical protein